MSDMESNADDWDVRAKVLLKATLDILKKCDEGPYVKNVMSTTAIWDGVECDGGCLMEEIETFLNCGM